MVEYKQVITSIKASWVKRLLTQGTTTFRAKWRYLALKMCAINDTETLILCKILKQVYSSAHGAIFYNNT